MKPITCKSDREWTRSPDAVVAYRIAPEAQSRIDGLVVSLRRAGYAAWSDSSSLNTDASRLAVNLTYGSPFWAQS